MGKKESDARQARFRRGVSGGATPREKKKLPPKELSKFKRDVMDWYTDILKKKKFSPEEMIHRSGVVRKGVEGASEGRLREVLEEGFRKGAKRRRSEPATVKRKGRRNA